MTLKDYFRDLRFDFIETYSFHRGPQLEHLLDISEYTDNAIHSSLLTDVDGAFNKTSNKVGEIRSGTREFEALESVILGSPGDLWRFMCAPIYRDALVFRSADNVIVDVLNICFDCMYMKNSFGTEIETGKIVYDELSKWFRQIGHSIDKDETLRLYKKLAALKKKVT